MRAGAPGRGSAGGSVEVAVEIKAGTEAGTEVGTRADASIAAFCDAIWLEDGLAANSLAAYLAYSAASGGHMNADGECEVRNDFTP